MIRSLVAASLLAAVFQGMAVAGPIPGTPDFGGANPGRFLVSGLGDNTLNSIQGPALGSFTYTVPVGEQVDALTLTLSPGAFGVGGTTNVSEVTWQLIDGANNRYDFGALPMGGGFFYDSWGPGDTVSLLLTTAAAPAGLSAALNGGAGTIGLGLSAVGTGAPFVGIFNPGASAFGTASLSLNTAPIAGVPEPGTWLIFGLGAFAAMRRRRRAEACAEV